MAAKTTIALSHLGIIHLNTQIHTLNDRIMLSDLQLGFTEAIADDSTRGMINWLSQHVPEARYSALRHKTTKHIPDITHAHPCSSRAHAAAQESAKHRSTNASVDPTLTEELTLLTKRRLRLNRQREQLSSHLG